MVSQGYVNPYDTSGTFAVRDPSSQKSQQFKAGRNLHTDSNALNASFFGSKDAGHHAAMIYTIVENCHRFEVPVEDYLREVLELLPSLKGAEEKAADLTPRKERRRPPRRSPPEQSQPRSRGSVGTAYLCDFISRSHSAHAHKSARPTEPMQESSSR